MVKNKDLEVVRIFKEKVSQTIPVDKIYLFGSRAKGKTHEFSDYDLIIISKKFTGVASRYRPLGFYKYWDSSAPFDFLCYTPEEFKKLRKQSTFISEAVKERVEV